MEKRTSKNQGSAGNETRGDRLKSALKANLARRKAQARARGAKASEASGRTDKES